MVSRTGCSKHQKVSQLWLLWSNCLSSSARCDSGRLYSASLAEAMAQPAIISHAKLQKGQGMQQKTTTVDIVLYKCLPPPPPSPFWCQSELNNNSSFPISQNGSTFHHYFLPQYFHKGTYWFGKCFVRVAYRGSIVTTDLLLLNALLVCHDIVEQFTVTVKSITGC